ncbi:MAG: glycosyltransferase [Bacteroidales bacterium]
MTDTKHLSIVVLPSWYPPAGGAFFREHSRALSVIGIDVSVLAPVELGITDNPVAYLTFSGHLSGENQAHFRELRQWQRRIPLVNKLNVRRWVNQAINMYQAHTKQHGHPDIIQAHSAMWAGLAAAGIKKRFGTPYVITEHRGRFTHHNDHARKLIKSWHKPLLKEAFTKADHIVPVSVALQRGIMQLAPESHRKLSVIPNMTDTRLFIPAETSKSPEEPFTFMCVASLEKLKGVDVLLNAFARLQERINHPVKLVIGGDGDQRKALEALRNRLGLDADVEFTGKLARPELVKHLQKAHAFVLPSMFEAFGVVIIEAMACALPVIATRSGGPESIVTKQTGLLVPPEDPGSMASAMEAMINSYKNYNPDIIRQYAEKHFSREGIANRYLRLYEKLLTGKTR